jgi:hypothetical protein
MSDGPHPATKDRLGDYDAIETAKPGEPLFPIQGGDPHGPPTVLFWAKLCREAGLAETKPEEAVRLLRKASQAEAVAWAMQAYQRGLDAVPGATTYHDTTADYLATADQRSGLIRGSTRLHNVLADALPVAEMLARFRVHPEQEVNIREAVELLKEAAFAIEPRRGNERS